MNPPGTPSTRLTPLTPVRDLTDPAQGRRILENRSDIDPYGAHSEAEFFAVVSEYFFEKPGELQKNNPELYRLLTEVFRQNPI